jgi:hypothetical protein
VSGSTGTSWYCLQEGLPLSPWTDAPSTVALARNLHGMDTPGGLTTVHHDRAQTDAGRPSLRWIVIQCEQIGTSSWPVGLTLFFRRDLTFREL